MEADRAERPRSRERVRRVGRWLVRSVPRTRQRLAEHDLLLLAAGLTFYAAISVVPLLLVAVFLAGSVLGADQVHQLAQRLAELAPEGVGFAARLVGLVRAGVALAPVAVVAALIPATTYGEGLLRALDRLAGVRTRRKGLRGRLKAIALLGTMPLLVLGAFGVVAVLPGLIATGSGSALLGGYLTFWAAWIGATLLIGVTYRAFSPVPLATSGLLWASAGTGSFIAGMSLGWVVVLEAGVEVGRAYGGSEDLGAGVLFAIYLFLLQLACLVGYAWALELSRASRGCPPQGRTDSRG